MTNRPERPVDGQAALDTRCGCGSSTFEGIESYLVTCEIAPDNASVLLCTSDCNPSDRWPERLTCAFCGARRRWEYDLVFV